MCYFECTLCCQFKSWLKIEEYKGPIEYDELTVSYDIIWSYTNISISIQQKMKQNFEKIKTNNIEI